MAGITLTRAQWNAIWDAAKQAQNSASDLCGIRDALDELGCVPPVKRIERAQGEIGDCARIIFRILNEASEGSDSERGGRA